MPRITSSETIDVRGTLDLTSSTAVLLKNNSIPKEARGLASLEALTVPLTSLRVWDDLGSLLPGTASADDLAVIEGTFGTDAPTIQTSDSKATSVTQYARFQYVMPTEYFAGEDVQIRIRGGMVTTVSDTTATVDVEVYAYDDDDGAVGSDLCTTAAQSINSLTKTDKDFVITSTSLIPGDTLDVRIAVAITDSATGTAVIGEVSQVAVLADIAS